VPSILISPGIGLLFACSDGIPPGYSSAFRCASHLDLAVRLLIMFAVFNRFDLRYEEAARDLGATSWQTIPLCRDPICCPADRRRPVRLHAFLRRVLAQSLYFRHLHTLPLEIYGMTTNVTTPVLYALGTP